jgi:hypothetical protein
MFKVSGVIYVPQESNTPSCHLKDTKTLPKKVSWSYLSNKNCFKIHILYRPLARYKSETFCGDTCRLKTKIVKDH